MPPAVQHPLLLRSQLSVTSLRSLPRPCAEWAALPPHTSAMAGPTSPPLPAPQAHRARPRGLRATRASRAKPDPPVAQLLPASSFSLSPADNPPAMLQPHCPLSCPPDTPGSSHHRLSALAAAPTDMGALRQPVFLSLQASAQMLPAPRRLLCLPQGRRSLSPPAVD